MSAAALPIMGGFQLILAQWSLSGLDASGKWIMQFGVPLLVLCWVRYLGHLLLSMALVLPARGPAILRSQKSRFQLLRGGFMLFSTLSVFTTLSYLPQAEATAINFLAPLLVLALAPLFLREPPRASRWVAALAGFIGVLIIIRPSSNPEPVGTAFGLLTACLFAGQYMANRLVAVDNPMTTLIWSGAVGTLALTVALPFTLPAALPILAALTPLQWLVLILTGFWGGLGHLLQIQAYRNAPASMLSPLLYMQIIAASALGWLIWGQFPDAVTWLGIAIVAVSGILISLYEWRHR